MTAKFGDLDDFLDPGLEVTVRGRDYVLPLASAELGLWCRRIAQTDGTDDGDFTDEELREAGERARARFEDLPPLLGMETLTFEEILLGDVYAQMVTDQQPDPYIRIVAGTAYIWIVAGEDAAKRFYEAGGRPESVARGNRAQRRAAMRGKTSTGTETETPSPASSTGTSTRRRSGGSGRGRGSRGRRS